VIAFLLHLSSNLTSSKLVKQEAATEATSPILSLRPSGGIEKPHNNSSAEYSMVTTNVSASCGQSKRSLELKVFRLLLVFAFASSYFFQIVDGQPDLGTCAVEGSNPLTPDPVTNACACRTGWTGPECSVCTASSACQAASDRDNEGNSNNVLGTTRMSCERSLEVIEKTHGVCRVTTQAVSNFLQGQAFVTAQITAAGAMHFEFVKVHFRFKSLSMSSTSSIRPSLNSWITCRLYSFCPNSSPSPPHL
jgi:hypothetical protein